MESTIIERINISEGCNEKCENCERYFDCNLPLKNVFQNKGILSLIRKNLKPVKHKVVILGGKGGVGKSMLTVNLAAALALKGKKVCILDQVYDCPAIPIMMNVDKDARLLIGENGLIPYEGPLGIKIISTGLILHADEIIIWFHDMKRNATEELLAAVDYSDTDYLVVDIPTGTSSETVNILKYMPDIDSAVVITVPTAVSQNVARKCIYILKKSGTPVIGVIENMSETTCPHCAAPAAPMQSGGGEKMAKEEGITFLGKLPISHKISTSLDEGEPFVTRYPDSEEAKVVMRLAEVVIRHSEGGNSPEKRENNGS